MNRRISYDLLFDKAFVLWSCLTTLLLYIKAYDSKLKNKDNTLQQECKDLLNMWSMLCIYIYI